MPHTVNIPDLIRDVSTRSGRAILSQLALRSPSLREYLAKQYAREPGEPGSLLADPVVEAAFAWKLSGISMADLSNSGFLSRELVAAMNHPDREFRDEYSFPDKRQPFKHQLACWQRLLEEKPQSVLVTSGTGSGKTECFLVPILEDLVRERMQAGHLTGVRALFLYPLNALINSQRDRLRAWCNGFGHDIRFCLYNGETAEFASADKQRRARAEQISRKALRENPAPILVTNSTMLEYMLVRAEDRPILKQSRGKLRWIVLDEAHTYIGSQAAEMALLLRRVLHSFETNPSEVRFVATSATIGDDNATDELQRFLSDLSGTPRERVHVVVGERFVPPLPPLERASSSQNIEDIPLQQLYTALCQHPLAREIRKRLEERPATLGMLRDATGVDSAKITLLLEKASTAIEDDQVFLPLRVHLFHRAQRGLWACVNAACAGRDASVAEGWKFGAISPSRRNQCSHCDSPIYELVACAECGQDYLSAIEEFSSETNQQKLVQFIEVDDIDDNELPDTDPSELSRFRRLICGPSLDAEHIEEFRLGQDRSLSVNGEGISIRLSPLNQLGTMECVRCGARNAPRRLFRELRIGAPFALSTIIPAALEHTPPMQGRRGLPSHGRRLLGFSDSRQGSARLAVRLQQEAERNRVRSVLYHALAAERDVHDLGDQEAQVAALEALGPDKLSDPVLRQLLEKSKDALAKAQAARGLGSLSWNDAINRLKGDSSLQLMRKSFRETTYIRSNAEEFARFCLYREFFRRPKRMNSAETMGLICLSYPALESIDEPYGWSLDLNDWTNFLKLVLDFFVRDASAVNVDDDYLRWMGIPVRKRYVQGPGFRELPTRYQRLWPSARPGRRPSRILRLLRIASGLDDSPESDDRINEIFAYVWEALRLLFQPVEDGYLLKLDEVTEISELSSGAICPYTARVLDTTLRGISPYLPRAGAEEVCLNFSPPRIPKAYWRDKSGAVANREEITHWLESDQDVLNARRLGVWTNLNDRIAANTPYFQAAEHSAQLDSTRLRTLERRFKEGKLNVLSCSTTMEMGVDIGGLSAVIMNNAPPSSANYLQRAGRAGRRGEGVSFAITLCPSSPHGEQVFSNPLWPFTTTISVPRVGLDSARLVQRHVNALCLGTFLGARDIRRLKAGWFFEPDESASSPAAQFVEWCRSEGENSEELVLGIKRLVKGTAASTSSTPRLMGSTADALKQRMDAWQREVDALRNEAEQFRDDAQPPPPAILAIERQISRLMGEYLLSDLANAQFLPGYGFPTGVVSFVPTTIDDLKQRQRDRENREEALEKKLGYPSRQMQMAIREYAPGAEIVIDGRVYESGGVTLNWHIPPGVDSASEVQALRYVWRCRQCGVTGDTVSFPSQNCTQCEGVLEMVKYLEPAGFAVDLWHRPHNNVVSPTFIPVEPPWISCPTPDWTSFANPGIGRFRYTDAGHLFYGSRGTNGFGYAVCLRCGRAASETGPKSETEIPDAVQEGHRRLRGGKERDGTSVCSGTGFAIQRELMLGGSNTTDVFELQITGLQDAGTALSLGIALRRAFCRRIGIEEQEVGITTRPSRSADGTVLQSVFLFDSATGGNGYVAALRDHITASICESAKVLDCIKQCDTACHGCLLTFDTQYDSAKLDRHKARAFLTEERLAGLQLQPQHRLLGPDSRVLTRPLNLHLPEVVGQPTFEEIRIWFAGDPKMWDIESFPLYRHLLQWADEARILRICVAPQTWSGLKEGLRHSLASLVAAGHGRIEVHLVEAPKTGHGSGVVVAAAGARNGSVLWALTEDNAPAMNEAWGQPPEEVLCVYAAIQDKLPQILTSPLDIEKLRPRPKGTVAIIPVATELNGRIEGFGARFWTLMLTQCRQLDDEFELNGPLTRVSYSDRYVTSPLAILLLREILLDLVRQARVDDSTSLHLLTQNLRHNRRGTIDGSIFDPFPNEMTRKDLFAAAMQRGRSKLRWMGPVNFHTGNAPHFRELRIEWGHARGWSLKLDQGVGYWRCRPSTAFPFGNSRQDQLLSLNGVARRCRAVARGSFPTFIYLARINVDRSSES